METALEKELIFGLDIGTRTIIGIVGRNINNKFHVLGSEIIEHEERAMQDGQIHDIQKVASAVIKVKTNLENRLGIQLKEVSIAAAGRSLNTQIVFVENKFEEQQEISAMDISKLELQGVELAKQKQKEERGMLAKDYFCVAHSVIHYFLNDSIVSNLEGHKATSIGAKILATFLPKVVIDSLYSVTERAGLKVVNLTLEPIAAINAVIPENLRLLNLALVDIGAGTSDIAITKEGSVIAYGMIPVAGDEVTEAIVHHYLVDFNTAEKIKQDLNIKEVIEFEDILNFKQQIEAQAVKAVIAPTIEGLAQSIAHKIMELNGGKTTNAVFCVGGGSQMPGVAEKIAELLQLPEQRVALRTADNVMDVVDNTSTRKGPDIITPFGICLTTVQKKYSEFTYVEVNKEKIELLNTRKLTVLDAVLAAGVEHHELFPKRGETLMFKLNGERVRVKGEPGEASRIMLNGKPSNINELIAQDDEITIIKGKEGKDGFAIVNDFVKKDDCLSIYVNDELIKLPIILVNGDVRQLDYEIQQNDVIEIISIHTLEEFMEYTHIQDNKVIRVNYEEVEANYQLKNMDSVSIQNIEQRNDRGLQENREYLFSDSEEQKIDEKESEKQENSGLQSEENIVIVVNNKPVIMPKKETEYMLASVFDFIDFDLSKPQGTIQLVLNGRSAALTDRIKDKDILEIFWKK